MSPVKQLVLASNNAGKLTELKAMLAPLNIEVLPQSQFAVTEVDETGLSFVENAILKARHASRQTGLPALADDSGLAVNALGGAPGIYSARYAGEHGDDAANNAKLLRELEPHNNRAAQFVCLLALVRHAEDPLPIIAQGLWQGQILHQPKGENGFGYDPLFQPNGLHCASAELSREQKNALSHRAIALRLLVEQLSA